MEEQCFFQIGKRGHRDPFPIIESEILIPLEQQEDYAVYALYTCFSIQGHLISQSLTQAALLEWQQRYPEGGNTSERFWAILMDNWVEKRLQFLPEEKRRSVSLSIQFKQFSSWETRHMAHECFVYFGDGSKRKALITEVPRREPDTERFFKARMLGTQILEDGKPTGYAVEQIWILAKSERVPR